MPDFTGFSHVGLSVTDLDRSVAWYTDVLGFQLVMPTDEPGFRRALLAHPGTGMFLGLTQHERSNGAPFDEANTGLDHFSLVVADRDELDAWARHLDDKGVVHSPISEPFYASVLVFRDPDNIQLELFVPKPMPS